MTNNRCACKSPSGYIEDLGELVPINTEKVGFYQWKTKYTRAPSSALTCDDCKKSVECAMCHDLAITTKKHIPVCKKHKLSKTKG